MQRHDGWASEAAASSLLPDMSPMDASERFTSDCWVASTVLKKRLNYNASRFNQMLEEHGGVETARRLINSDTPSQGFGVLWEHHRLDLSVEAIAILPDYEGLLTAVERASARRRLTDHGFDVDAYLKRAQIQRPPWDVPPTQGAR